VLQLDAHELHCKFSVFVDKGCAEVIVLNVGDGQLAAWLGDYCIKQNVERGHRCGVGAHIAVVVDLVSDSDAMHQLAHFDFCSAVRIVICYFVGGGDVFIYGLPISLRLT
jgi:hypothetical protein